MNRIDSDLIINTLTNAFIKNITIFNKNNIKRRNQAAKLEFLSNVTLENFTL